MTNQGLTSMKLGNLILLLWIFCFQFSALAQSELPLVELNREEKDLLVQLQKLQAMKRKWF